ncbi:uncharacterized protein LOC105393970 isoform X2 [Plutella xylostella]|uniref:uncharacterized protein LOC105393970 isoform X2 n=1 Tax=Plutella xylostella TaxID=51655 RepID=UPI002033143C|nr:uncharacterized protein LOC105393970 isoform X2 [Plutella xylostella]
MADETQPQIGGGEGLAEPPVPTEQNVTIPPVDKPVDAPVDKTEEKPVESPVEVKTADNPAPAAETKPVENNVEADVKTNWQEREAELLKKIDDLENVKNQAGIEKLKLELKVRTDEVQLLKARVAQLETELQAAISKPGSKNHEVIEAIKAQHEELLNKAKGMIFDKSKMVKNQELQIEALNTQVQSLKDINMITKDLLEMRNSEVKAMEDRFQAMDARFKAEKDRYSLVLKKAETSTGLNDDLKKEYMTQLGLFKELREKYDERVKALVAENEKLKEEIKADLISLELIEKS